MDEVRLMKKVISSKQESNMNEQFATASARFFQLDGQNSGKI
jgi:hypothetical protein